MKKLDHNLLKLYKIYPKIEDFNYLKYQYYIYIYLNPFKEYKKPKLIKFKVDNKDYEYITMYEPFYIGKASNGGGYRHNQHIQKFKSEQEGNKLKTDYFKELELNFEKAQKKGIFYQPHNWKEFQRDWICILKDFNNPKDLIKFEMSIIKSLGTIYNKKGPLVNKIENSYIY